MSFIEAIKHNFRNYVTFSGRARRSEFWWWILFVWLGAIALSIVDLTLFGTTVDSEPGSIERTTNFAPFSWIFMLAVLLPTISVAVRRLHDRDKSGWWYWLGLVPIVGPIILIVWFAMEGTRGDNKYGPDPLANPDPLQ